MVAATLMVLALLAHGLHPRFPPTIEDAARSDVGAKVTEDPLIYSTYLGGSYFDSGNGIALDAWGQAYVVGQTDSPDFPVTPDAFDTGYNYNGDIYVAKLSYDGSGLRYATYLGGGSWDGGPHVAVAGDGSAYVAGTTESWGFPTTADAFDRTLDGERDGFVVRLSPEGGELRFATFLGGSGNESISDVAVDSLGNVYVSGFTASPDFPVENTSGNGYEGDGSRPFVAKLNPLGSELAFVLLPEVGAGLALDEAGYIYLSGSTTSPDWPTTTGAFDRTFNGETDLYVVKLTPDGRDVVYATYLGGSGTDWASTLAVDGDGHAYIAATTNSPDIPSTLLAVDETYNGDSDILVAKFATDGSDLSYATYLGGSGFDGLWMDIVADSAGKAYVTGYTHSEDFPVSPGAVDKTSGGSEAFAAILTEDGQELSYATYLGGSEDDVGTGIAVDSYGTVYVTGNTEWGFPVTNGAFQQGSPLKGNAFATRFALAADATPPEIAITLPSSGIVNTKDVNVTWEASDVGWGIQRFEVDLDGEEGAALPGFVRNHLLTGLDDGAHVVTVTAFDHAGYARNATLSFRVDTNPLSPTGPYGVWLLVAVILIPVAAVAFILSERRYRWLRRLH